MEIDIDVFSGCGQLNHVVYLNTLRGEGKPYLVHISYAETLHTFLKTNQRYLNEVDTWFYKDLML